MKHLSRFFGAAVVAAMMCVPIDGWAQTAVTLQSPSFESSSTTGWAVSGMKVQTNTSFDKTGSCYLEKWNSTAFGTTINPSISQSVTLTAGYYVLTAAAGAYNTSSVGTNGEFVLYLGDNTVNVNGMGKYMLRANIATDGTYELGFKKNVTTSLTTNWVAVDNFVLTRYDSESAYLSSKNNTDFTSSIYNASYEIDNHLNGWVQDNATNTMEVVNNNSFTNKKDKYYLQKWVASGTLPDCGVSQTITNLPNGRYNVSVYANSTGTGSSIYANSGTTNIEMNNNKQYAVVGTVTDGTLKIGITTKSSTGGWIACDSWSMTFLGTASYLYDQAVAAAKTLYASTDCFQASLRTDLSNEYSKAVSTDEEKYTVIANLASITNSIQTSKTTYVQLKAAIDDVTNKGATVTGAPDAAKTTFNKAVSDANTAYTNGTYADADVPTAITTLNAALVTYVKAQTASGSDFTLAIVNPSFENNLTGWTQFSSTTPMVTQTNTALTGKDGSIYVERYIASGSALSDCGVYQTITGLPTGYYKASAVAQIIQQKTNVAGTGAVVYAGSKEVTVGLAATYTTQQFHVTDGSLTIGYKVVGTTGNWTAVDNFKLVYSATFDATDALASLTALLATVPTGNMNSTVQSTLTSAQSTAQALVTAGAGEEEAFTSAYSALQSAITAANASITVYATLKTAIDDVTTKGATISSTAEAKATFDAVVTAATAGYNNATYDDAEAKSEVTALYDALRVYVKTQTATGSNYTLAIINPSFETGDMTGWTYVSESGVNDYGVRSTTNTTYKMTNSDGSYLFNTWWRGIPISQTITGLRNGHYTLTAVTSTDAGAITYLFANNCHVGITAVAGPSTGYEGTLDFSVTDGTAKIGVIGCSQNKTWDETNYWYWYKVDNFRLTYQGEMQTVTLDEAADYTPASEFCNVTFIRSLKPSHWNTLCVPFSVANADIATVFGAGAQVANYTGVTLNDNNYTTLNFTTTDAKIEANKPCLIKITTDPAPSSYALQNVTLTTDAVSNIAQTGTNTTLNKSVTATMIGTYSKITVPTTDAYVISNDNFYLVDVAVTLKAFRAYFSVPASTTNSVKALNVNVDGQTTAVEGINSDVQSISGNVYNMNGQLVRKNAATMNGLTKGIYIMNGKKVVVK
jgi:hypothetical protein